MISALAIGFVADLFIGICLAVLVWQHRVYVAERQAWRIAEGLQIPPDQI